MLRPRHVVLLALVGIGATSSALVHAQPKARDKGTAARPREEGKTGKSDAAADVETAEQLYTKLDYDKANEVADRVTKQRGLTHEQLVRAYRVLAVTDAALDKEEAAREAFFQLLVYNPEYSVDNALGPKVTTPFVEARGQLRSLVAKPGIDVAANVRSDGGQLRVTMRDPTHIAKKLTVGYRWTSSGDYTVSTLPVGDGVVEVAPATQGRTRLDFYAQALDERENAVFEAGSAQVPKSAFAQAGAAPIAPTKPAAEKSGGSILSSPVFWIVAGAVVAGGGTAMFVALRPEDPATKAALRPTIRCGSEICK